MSSDRLYRASRADGYVLLSRPAASFIFRNLQNALWLCLLLPMAARGAAGNNYVDARICAGCHAKIAQDYLRTGMGRSLVRPTPANSIENYAGNNEFYHALSDTHYSMISRGGVYYQRRWQIGFDGKESNVEETKIDYVIGSGNHARSYFHRSKRKTLIELPLGWYAEKNGSWGMSPGFDSPHPATRRLASYECVFCHDAYPRIPAGYDAPGSEPVFSGELPQGINCQRCHGPGGNHVATVQTTGASQEKIRASIVNPARLNANLQMDVCMQCHLEPTSTAIPAVLRRFNRAPFSFFAGEPLSAFLLTFDQAPGTQHEGKFEIVGSSSYRLRQSRCFLETKGELTCVTCHNPHRAPRAEDAERQYSQVCLKCHAAALDTLSSSGKHPVAAGCITCHMPKRRTEDVVHVVMTDHLIQRRSPSRDLLAELKERHPTEAQDYHGEVVPYYPATLPQSGPDALYRALAQVAQKNNLRVGVIELARLMASQKPRESAWHLQLGDAWLASGEPVKAVDAYKEAVRLSPQTVRPLRALAEALKEAAQLQLSGETLLRAIQLAPSDAGSWYEMGKWAAGLGQTGQALTRLQKAIALDPGMPGAYTTLAVIEDSVGHKDAAETALRDALRVDPYDAAAWDLTGRALAEKRQFPEALYDFEKATRYRPGFGPYLYEYALTLASDGQLNRAEESAEAAARADPNLAEPHALLGRIFSQKRRLAAAAAEFQEAIRLRPDFMQARLDLASVLVAENQVEQAVQQLREVVKGADPQSARLAADALQRLGGN